MNHPVMLDLSSYKLPDLIELRVTQKVAVTKVNQIAKEEKQALDELDAAIMAKLDELGVEGSHNAGHSVNITEEWVPTEIDWDTFLPWAAEHDQLHLLQRRVAVTAWREYETIAGEYPPGTEAHKKRALSVTKRKSNKK